MSDDQAEQPLPPMPAIERVVEILEALFNLEKDLTGELLVELARCDTADLVKLFGCSTPTSRATGCTTRASVTFMSASIGPSKPPA